MTTLADLQTEILDIVQAPDETNETVIVYINKGLLYIASKVLLDQLESSDVITSEASGITAIPTSWNFHRNLFDCQIEEQDPITILNSIEQLTRVYPSYDVDAISGPVEYALVHKGQVVYYPIPDIGTEIKCKYFEKPTPLALPADEPICIIEGLQEELLVSYCCMKIWDKEEDGTEGVKINTKHYFNALIQGLIDLEDVVETGQSRPLPRRPIGWV